MTDPKRLLEEGTTFERYVLEASRDDVPANDLERRVLAAMRGAPVPPPGRFTRWSKAKTFLAGAVALGVAAGVVATVGHHRTPDVSPPPAAVVQPAVDAPSEKNDETSPLAVVTPDSLPSVAPPSAAKPSAPIAAPAAPTPTASIEREVILLDAVKASLNEDDVPAAIRHLDAYDGEFPVGSLRPEATVLRIRALLLRGDRAAAEKLGDDFLARHPNGVHAKRVRALLSP